MRKTLRKDNLAERPAARALLALSLTAALAGFGCTTNRTTGNGDPLQGAPGVGPGAPTSGVNGGSSSGTGNVNPPMMSSSTLPLSADEAAAVLAGNRFSRGVRVLGPVNPGNSVRTSASDATGQYQNPAMNLNPIVTVNSSVNSVAHVPGIASGTAVTDAGAIADATTLTNAIAASNAITSNAAVAGTTVANTGGVAFSPSAAGTTLATTSSSSPTPTVAASSLPSPTVTTNATTAANPIRVSQGANGRVTVTNASSKPQQ